jgi:autotransporter-associated beta strand protein
MLRHLARLCSGRRASARRVPTQRSLLNQQYRQARFELFEERRLLTALYWQGQVDSFWGTSGNWSLDAIGTPTGALPVNGDTLIFDSTTAGLARFDSQNNLSPGSGLTLVIDDSDPANKFSLTGNAISLAPVGIDHSSDSETDFALGLSLQTPTSIESRSGLLNIMTTVNNGGNLMAVGGQGNVRVSANISGGGGLTKGAGSGTVELQGSNGYTGATTVLEGTLLVNGSINIASAVAVHKSATLAGTGAVPGPVSVLDGGRLSPGQSPGVLNTGGLTMFTGSLLSVEISSATFSDLVLVSGAVDLNADGGGGAQLIGSRDPTYLPVPGTVLTIINNDTNADLVQGQFAQGSTVVIGGVTFAIDYAGGDGNDVTLQVVTPNTVYVDDSWAGTPPAANPSNNPLGELVFGYNAFDNIQDAINRVNPGGSVVVFGGAYTGMVDVFKPLARHVISDD